MMNDSVHVASLALYPVKSCAGIALESATLTAAGLMTQGIGDREWMVVNQSGEFVTQRQLPWMATIRPQIDTTALTLHAPSIARSVAPCSIRLGEFALRSPTAQVRVWGHACAAFDEGDEAAAWLSAILKQKVRLVRFDPAHQRVANRERTRGKDGGITALNRFSDGYPILLANEASLADLNDRLQEAGREVIPINRFRPNVVVSGVAPYEEDHLARLLGHSYGLAAVKPCARCPIPSIDQTSGERGPSVLDILQTYRARDDFDGGVMFGQNVIVCGGVGQEIRVGDSLQPEWNF